MFLCVVVLGCFVRGEGERDEAEAREGEWGGEAAERSRVGWSGCEWGRHVRLGVFGRSDGELRGVDEGRIVE